MNIVVSSGDLNGIGLECFIKALSKLEADIDFTLIANYVSISDYLSALNFTFSIENNTLFVNKKAIKLINIDENAEIQFGKTEANSGKHAAISIDKAIEEMQNSNFDAMLTLPISKEAIQEAGWNFPGHTELIAEKFAVKNPIMILCNERIRVMTLTIHIPISEVSNHIKKDYIIDQTKVFHHSLKYDFAITEPKIALLGLNPHAGENGKIGKEELSEIIPAINSLKEQGINAEGPFPADGFFAHREYLHYDGIISMYHDQGLIPLKMLAAPGGVNFTGNLPIIRTSPDHGTAFAIAGNGIADETSTLDAINMAKYIYGKRKNTR